MTGSATAFLGGLCASGLIEVRNDLEALDTTGRWAVLIPYDGEPVLARFERWESAPVDHSAQEWRGAWSGPDDWASSMDREDYLRAVEAVRELIAAGEVYQANVCRILSAELPDSQAMDITGLHALLQRDHPSPFGGMIYLPDHDVHVATASPELFLRRRGDIIESAPIKGTATSIDRMLDKDRAENVMIVDLVRNDLARVCRPGTVTVAQLMATEDHPGLVHLVSTVRGHLQPWIGWPELLRATFPPGSVTGAPKYTALRIIDSLEPVSRGPYCGAIGWVDADTGEAELAVAIRTFWRDRDNGRDVVRFGTGAGITWGSNPSVEWAETELKAAELIKVASRAW